MEINLFNSATLFVDQFFEIFTSISLKTDKLKTVKNFRYLKSFLNCKQKNIFLQRFNNVWNFLRILYEFCPCLFE